MRDPEKPDEDKDFDLGSYEVEGCHRLLSTNKAGIKNTIIRFTNRRVCEEALSNKRRIKNIKLEELKGTEKNIFINENMCSYYNNLAAKARRLVKKEVIEATWIQNWTVKIKLKNQKIMNIFHQSDLDKLFPDFVYFE